MGKKRKKRFTIEQHIETGQKLKEIDDICSNLYVEIANHYPKEQVKKTLKAINQTRNWVGLIRHRMEDFMSLSKYGEVALKTDQWPVKFPRVYWGSERRFLTEEEKEALIEAKPLFADRE